MGRSTGVGQARRSSRAETATRSLLTEEVVTAAELRTRAERALAEDRFADALHKALTMPPEEQEQRMRRLRDHIAEHNIYEWAGMILSDAAKLLNSRR